MNFSFLDRLRGVSILLVFLIHAVRATFGEEQLPWQGLVKNFSEPPGGWSFYLLYPLTYGYIGVAMFFVISGFCIHLSFTKDPLWTNFFVKRFFRIYPPYLITLLIVVIIQGTGVFDALLHAGLVHNFLPSTLYTISGSFWSIAVEAQLYLIYPLVYFIGSKSNWKLALLATGMVELLIRGTNGFAFFYETEGLSTAISFSPFGFWVSWSLGAYLADRLLRKELSKYSPLVVGLVIGLIIVCGFFKPLTVLVFPLSALATMMVMANNLTRTNDSFFGNALRFLGACSYSFYLWHFFILRKWSLGLQIAGIKEPILLFLLTLPSYVFILFVSHFFYKIVELNSVKIGKRFQISRPMKQSPKERLTPSQTK